MEDAEALGVDDISDDDSVDDDSIDPGRVVDIATLLDCICVETPVEDADVLDAELSSWDEVEAVRDALDLLKVDSLAHVQDEVCRIGLGRILVEVTPQETIKLVTKHCATSLLCK